MSAVAVVRGVFSLLCVPIPYSVILYRVSLLVGPTFLYCSDPSFTRSVVSTYHFLNVLEIKTKQLIGGLAW